MTDEQRGYRKERPLAEIIPPDRRRFQAAALVVLGMIAGAALLAFVQDLTKPEKPVAIAPPRPPQETDIRSFTVGVASADITSRRPGEIESDGQPDQSFDLVVDGPIASIRIASVDSAGRPFGTSTWGTSGDPKPWQLAVFESSTPLNAPDGSLLPLADGRHWLRLYASDNGSFEPGSYFRAYVVRPDTRVAASEALAFTGHGPAHEKPKPRIPPSEQAPASPVFDRGAAASALGSVDVARCRSEAGVDGAGHVTVVFANDGKISHVEVDQGGNEKTARGTCIAKAFEKARVPAFAGAPVRVGKSFVVGAPTTGTEAR